MTVQAKTNSDYLFDKIATLFLGDKSPDQLVLARIKREIENVRKVNSGQGYCLLAMINCLEADVDSCKKHHELAIKLSGTVDNYLNYPKSLSFLGLSDEAFQQIKNALKIYPHNPDLNFCAILFAVNSGHTADVEHYYDALSKINPSKINAGISHIRSIVKKFSEIGVTHETASSLMKLADSLILKNCLHSFSKDFFTDETESNIDIYCWIEINANPAKVVEMNMELCQQIANDSYFCDKSIFSIAYRSR